MARHDANGPGACSTGNPQVQRPAKSAFAGGGPALDRRPMSGARRRLTMIELAQARAVTPGSLAYLFNRGADGLDPVAFFYPCDCLY